MTRAKTLFPGQVCNRQGHVFFLSSSFYNGMKKKCSILVENKLTLYKYFISFSLEQSVWKHREILNDINVVDFYESWDADTNGERSEFLQTKINDNDNWRLTSVCIYLSCHVVCRPTIWESVYLHTCTHNHSVSLPTTLHAH